MSNDRIAPEGALWMCCACGKTARDQYGIEGTHSYGWDASCMLNSMLVNEASIHRGPDGMIIHADPWEPPTKEPAHV